MIHDTFLPQYNLNIKKLYNQRSNFLRKLVMEFIGTMFLVLAIGFFRKSIGYRVNAGSYDLYGQPYFQCTLHTRQ